MEKRKRKNTTTNTKNKAVHVIVPLETACLPVLLVECGRHSTKVVVSEIIVNKKTKIITCTRYFYYFATGTAITGCPPKLALTSSNAGNSAPGMTLEEWLLDRPDERGRSEGATTRKH